VEDPAPEFEPPAPEFEPPAPEFEPPAPEFEPPAPEFEPPAPEFEPPAPGLKPSAPAPASTPEIAIHDTRREGPQATAIGASLERHAVDGLPFAALLIEIVGVERLAQAEPAAGLKELLDRVEVAIGPELRPSDVIVRESAGRWWLMASRTDLRGARTLAERLARTVRAAAGHRGQPLEVAIGVAVCPDDGGDAAALAAHADVGLYAARAAGQSVAPPDAA
jgi:GGDEF domain-containing protein